MDKVKFNILEGEDILEQIQEDFMRLYLDNTIKVNDICTILNISHSQFHNLRRRLVRRGVITNKRNKKGGRKKTKRYNRKQPKNYFWSRHHKKFHIKYRDEYYGCFKEEKDAKQYVELMRECGWDKSRMNELKEKVLSE